MNYNPDKPVEPNQSVIGRDYSSNDDNNDDCEHDVDPRRGRQRQRPIVEEYYEPLTGESALSSSASSRARAAHRAATEAAAEASFSSTEERLRRLRLQQDRRASDTNDDASSSSSSDASDSDHDDDDDVTKRVSFESVEIIELPFALGDNPSVSHGPPLTTEWEAQHRTTLDLDFFETYRPSRRTGRNLVVSYEDREKLLLEHGFSKQQIAAASTEAAKTKSLRRSSPPSSSPQKKKGGKGGKKKPSSSLSPPRFKLSSRSYSPPPPPPPPPASSPGTIDRWEANSFIPRLRDGKQGDGTHVYKDVLITPQRNSPSDDPSAQTRKSRTLSPARNIRTKKIKPDLLRIGKSLTMD